MPQDKSLSGKSIIEARKKRMIKKYVMLISLITAVEVLLICIFC